MMTARLTFGLVPLLLLAGCGGALPVANEVGANLIAPPILNEGGNDVIANDSAPAEGELSAYVGKYPFDKVDGTTFLDNAKVKAAVEATVPDAKVRAFIFGSTGPQGPIVAKDGRILAWGCEAHNCGPHQWSVSITPDGASADVCVLDQSGDKPLSTPSTWYLAGGKTEQRPDNCPSE